MNFKMYPLLRMGRNMPTRTTILLLNKVENLSNAINKDKEIMY